MHDVVRERVSRGDLLLLIAVLSAFGVVTSAYLTWQWYEAASSTWCDLDAYFSCTRVRESPYASVAGIPTSTVGLLGFAILLALASARLRGVATVGPWSTEGWLLGFSLVGTGLGVGLTLIEIFVIQAICILCLVAFALGLGALAAVAIIGRTSG